MNYKEIFYPPLALFIWTNILFFVLAFARSSMLRKKVVSMEYFKVFKNGQLSDWATAVTRNIANLFEVPMLFYVIIIFTIIIARFNNADIPNEMLYLAWAYVILRVLHSIVHITFNHVMTRFAFYLLSNVTLMGMWAMFYSTYYLGK